MEHFRLIRLILNCTTKNADDEDEKTNLKVVMMISRLNMSLIIVICFEEKLGDFYSSIVAFVSEP